MKSYNLSTSDALFIQEGLDEFIDVFIKFEGDRQRKMASYKGGKWFFDSDYQQNLFFKMLKQYPLRMRAAVLDYAK